MIQFAIILLLVFVIVAAATIMFLVYWPFYGAPFVPTTKKEISEIFKKIKLKKSQVFCDLGCGDGRLVRAATEVTGIKAIGVDINWGLVQWCKMTGNTKTEYICQNILKSKVPAADVYFLYFWPKLVDKIIDKLKSYGVKCTIVSKSFKARNYEYQRCFQINGSRFWVYELVPTKLKSGRH